MRKVIFVSGTSYSGTTFLDMILSNDEKGFSCGEVHALFMPYRSHHHNLDCGCGDSDCKLWQDVLVAGKENLYDTLFDKFPKVEFIVDSSKNPLWIAEQSKRLKARNYDVRNILIWKHPLELSHSFNKRGRLKDWEKAWINYHRLFFTFIHDWRSFKYYDLTKKPSTLVDICDYLDIHYFPKKIEYWQTKHHTLFGNTSAKIHLYGGQNKQFHQAEKELARTTGEDNQQITEKLQKIYYEEIDPELNEFTDQKMSSNALFRIIEAELLKRDIAITCDNTVDGFDDKLNSLQFAKFSKGMQLIKYKYLMKYFHGS